MSGAMSVRKIDRLPRRLDVITLYSMHAIMKMTFDPNAPNMPGAVAELSDISRAYIVGRIGRGRDRLRARPMLSRPS
jgi:hypothetical protein